VGLGVEHLLKKKNWDYQVTCNVIDNIFKVSYVKKHDVLILGALGCGAYSNPTREIAQIFKLYLDKYNGCFKTIIFAVLSKDDGSYNNNYNIFCEELLKK